MLQKKSNEPVVTFLLRKGGNCRMSLHVRAGTGGNMAVYKDVHVMYSSKTSECV